MFKNKCLYMGVILLFFTAAYAWADVNFQAADMSHWEQNSVRPIRIVLTPTLTGKVVGLDAYVKYNFPSVTQVFQTPSVTNFVTGLTMDNDMAYEAPPSNLPSNIKFSAYKGTSDPGWSVTNGSSNNVCDLTFTVNSGAPTGTTTFGWRTPSQIDFTGSASGNSPYSDISGTKNTQNVTITAGHDPIWDAFNTGINSKVSPVTSPDTGNILQASWNTAMVSDDTPYDITATAWDTHNLKFRVYRKRSDEGTYTLMTTTAQGASSYNDGNANGQYEGNEPYDCEPVHNFTYTYMLHALDNTITPREDTNTQTVVVKSHDYTAPASPTASSQAAPAQMYWTNNGTAWTGGNSFTGYVPGDKSVTLKWGATAASDLAGYLVIGSDASSWGSSSLGSASGDTNGPNYGAGNTVGSNGTVIATQAATQITRTKLKDGSTDLQNGVPYYYNISAYDLAEQYDGTSGAGQQGRNYSSTLQIVAIPGVAPSNATAVAGTKTASGVTVHWTNPSESYFDGVRIVVKVGGYSADPGDGMKVYEARGLTPGQAMSYTFGLTDCPDPLNTDYRVTVYTHNLAGGGDPADITKRRYSSGAQANYDTTAPGQISFLYAMPQTDTSLQLIWANPSDPDFSGVVILRKPGTSEFITGSLDPGVTHAQNDTIAADEVVAFVGSAEEFSDPGLTAAQQYYYRAWAYDSSLNYSNNYALTGSIPGGGLGVFFAGPTTVVPGWNVIATGQQTSKTLNQSTLIQGGNGALTGDEIYQLIPGTNNFKKAHVSGINQWIDDDLGVEATWEMAPDAGFFLKRNTGTPFTWEAR